MKKLAIIATLALAAASASATDIGLRAARFGGVATNEVGFAGGGVTLGQQFGKFSAELAYDRGMMAKSSVSRYGLVGSYPVGSLRGASFAAKAGVAFIDPTVGANGLAATVGFGVSYPLTKKVSLVADYAYQVGQDRVKSFNGNMVTIGTKYTF